MSCRKARRQLLWLVRFGELDQESAPHLDHLAGCRACRDEVGLDRALVRDLRTALAERVADAAPSPEAWEGILARMRQPEPRLTGLRGLMARFSGALRAGTAMAGAGLALVLALNLEVVPLAPLPAPTDAPEQSAARPAWAGEVPPFVDATEPDAPPPAAEEVAGEETLAVGLRPSFETEKLPPDRRATAEAGEPAPEPEDTEEVSDVENGWQVLAVRLVPSDAARFTGANDEAADEPAPEPDPASIPSARSPS